MTGLDTAIAATQDRKNGSGPSPLNEASKIKSTLEHILEPFPEPRHTLPGDRSFYIDVRRWLGIAGLAYLREHPRTPSHALALHLEDLLLDVGERWIDHKPSRYRIGFYNVEGLALSAAEWALEIYRPPYRRRFSKADAAKGGRNSKRTSKLFERYRELPSSFSITQAAKALNCHPRTISRLRNLLVLEQDRADQVILDELDRQIAEQQNAIRLSESRGTHKPRTVSRDEPVDAYSGRGQSRDFEGMHQMETPTGQLALEEMLDSVGEFPMPDGALVFSDLDPISLESVVFRNDDPALSGIDW